MTTYQTAYAKFLPLALQLPGDSIREFRGDVRLPLINIRLGVQAVLGTTDQINQVKLHLPLIPIVEVLDLPDLARALIYASGKIITKRKSDGEIEAAIGRVGALRSQFLDQAVVLANRGKFDKHVVAQIRKGHGKYDMAKDGIDLAGLYTEHAASIAGLHPFTQVEIDALRHDSEWLLEHVTPGGARKELVEKSLETVVRDRLWTMMTKRHEYLRKIGFYMYGDDFDNYIPKLLSRVPSKALEEAEQDTDRAAPAVN
jgi:hypothetical protein